MPGKTSTTTPPTCLLRIHEQLFEMGLYLGDMSFQDKVHWMNNGRADRLALVNPLELGDADQHLPSSSPDDTFELAPISAVVQIDNNNFWLMADTNFCGLTKICLDYTVIKPSCVCHMPEAAPFMADWRSVMDNLCWLQDQIAMPNLMCHVLFEALDVDELNMKEAASEEQSDKKENIEGLDGISLIDNWPEFSDAARGGLDSIRQMHWIIPIPAYDIEGKLIDPCCYHHHLESALAEVHFNISHWSISRNGVPGKDVYTADIVCIHVLTPPHASAASHSSLKRKMSAYLHPMNRRHQKCQTLKKGAEQICD
ncbi:hypothetical protein V8B97DRAFT_2024585 [Scleroderma yunnanense]